MPSVVYFLQGKSTGLIKIGWTAVLTRRIANLRGSTAEIVELLATVPGDVSLEAYLHERFAADRVRGEWFSPSRGLLAFVAEVKANGTQSLPAGLRPVEGVARTTGPHTVESAFDTARTLVVRAREILEREGHGRMAAYDILARRINCSSFWLMKLIGRRDGLSLHAHQYLNIVHVAEDMERKHRAKLLKELADAAA